MFLVQKYKSIPATAKASLWFIGCTALQKVMSFVTVPLFTAMMSEAAYGQYQIYQSWYSVIMIFATLCLHHQIYNNGAIRFSERTDQYVTSLTGLSWTAAVAVFAVIVLLSGLWTPVTGMPKRWILYMFLECAVFMPYNFYLCKERMRNHYRAAVAITLLYVFSSTILGLYLVRARDGSADARILAMVITECLIGLGLFFYLFPKGRRLYDREVWSYALKLTIPLIPHHLASVLLTSSDRIMIGRFCGDDKVAIYMVAASIGTIMQTIAHSTNAAVNPWIYRTMIAKDYRKLKKGTNLLYGIMAAATTVPTAFGVVYIRCFMKASYQEAIPLIGIIAASSFFIYLSIIFLVMELFFEQTKYTSIATAGTAVTNIVLNFVGIRLFGYRAAAYTTLICYILLVTAHYCFLRKTVRDAGIGIDDIIDIKLVVLLGIAVCAVSILISNLI